MIYDLAIIGGGPAGAAAAVYAARKRLRTVVITKDWLGQSSVSEKIENWIGNIAISGVELSMSLEKHAKAYGADVLDFLDGRVCLDIEKAAGKTADKAEGVTEGATYTITVSPSSEKIQAKAILIATGSGRRKLDVPGADKFEHKGLTYCASCDGPMYSGQDVAVIGGGNAGLETAAQLLAYCKSVTLLIRRGEYRADPGTVEKVLHHPNMRAITFAVPKEVKGDKFVTSYVYTDAQSGKDVEIPVTGIFVEIGSIPNTSFASKVTAMDEHGHIKVDPRTQQALGKDGKAVPGVWSAGDCTDGLYHQNNIAAGDAVKAVEDIYLYLRAR